MTQPAHQYEDPAAEGSTRAVHLAAMLLSIAEGVARLRAERLAAQATRDERDAAAAGAQQRADRAATWLEGRNHGRRTPAPNQAVPNVPVTNDQTSSEPVSSEPVTVELVAVEHVRISCTPRGLADKAFPIDVPTAMLTAPRSARDAVRSLAALPAPRPMLQLTAGTRPATGQPITGQPITGRTP
ncbi:MAG: hypothetical protein QG597_4978 [Actinomycetota bacterium]|nr:hypothetical protein [Actinomycetota bacterium]